MARCQKTRARIPQRRTSGTVPAMRCAFLDAFAESDGSD